MMTGAIPTAVLTVREFVTAPLTGLVIFSALALLLVERGLREASTGQATPAARLLDRRTTLLLVAFVAVVAARFVLLSG